MMGSRGEVVVRQSVAPRVLDGSVVQLTLASTAHFSVRGAPPPDSQSPILTTFIWKDSGARVMLAGSFDDWRKHEMTYVPDVGYFVLVTEVPPGNYFYRFVVDGRWRVADGDPNLREDMFGELSHYLEINIDSVQAGKPHRFSTASVARSNVEGNVVLDEGHSDTDDDDEDDEDEDADEEVEEAPDTRKSIPLPPRQRGDGFVEDYDDDACGELDLQADVFEAMKDVAETTTVKQNPQHQVSEKQKKKQKQKPGRVMLRKVWAMLFGEVEEEEEPPPPPTRNQNTHAMVGRRRSGKKGLRVWFPNEQNFPERKQGRKIDPAETKDVIDVSETAMKLHQVEENANNRQMLGKTLFAQGKYDAALALFSLSVKLREDNGLKNAKSTAVAHTDVASAFIHLEDFKNAEKHLRIALGIFQRGTFSGGRAQLGDVHCFLGVVADMKNELRDAELGYRNAIDIYEKCRATDNNPNYATALDNLNANIRRQKQLEMAGSTVPPATDHACHNPPQDSTSPTRSRGGAPKQSRTGQGGTPTRGKKKPQNNSPQTITSVHSLSPVRPTAASRPPPPIPGDLRSQRSGGPTPPRGRPTPPRRQAPPPPPSTYSDTASEASTFQSSRQNRQSARPKTWKDLADHARASMPKAPPIEDFSQEDETPAAGSYEEMSRQWHQDGRRLLVKGQFKEAMDMYTLAIYTRKRHGPWNTRDNAETHVEYARALFATKDLRSASESLRDAISILEQMNNPKHDLLLGETWGSLGAVLDRLGGHLREAEGAHATGMVVYGKAGMSVEDKRWMKAWRNLCANLTAQGPSAKTPDEIWTLIDLQIRGIKPMTKVTNVTLHG